MCAKRHTLVELADAADTDDLNQVLAHTGRHRCQMLRNVWNEGKVRFKEPCCYLLVLRHVREKALHRR
ncbi:Uncharacterised protein [Burkholderia pseudomallei]|nr:Uncharacterised protein [Burkholderia pseudomallei]